MEAVDTVVIVVTSVRTDLLRGMGDVKYLTITGGREGGGGGRSGGSPGLFYGRIKIQKK
jgi:hypothetical protein